MKREDFRGGATEGPMGIPHTTDVDFDQLRDRLLARTAAARGRVVSLFSLAAGEGVTAVIVGLARATSRLGGPRCLVVDHDDGPRGAGARLNLKGIPFSAVAASSSTRELLDRLRSSNGHGIDLLTVAPAGPVAPPDDSSWSQMLEEARSRYGLVLVDAGSRQRHPASPWARGADQVLLVIDSTRTTTEQIEDLKRELDGPGRPPIGIVLNKRRYHVPDALYRRLG